METLKAKTKSVLGFMVFLCGIGMVWAFSGALPSNTNNFNPANLFGAGDTAYAGHGAPTAPPTSSPEVVADANPQVVADQEAANAGEASGATQSAREGAGPATQSGQPAVPAGPSLPASTQPGPATPPSVGVLPQPVTNTTNYLNRTVQRVQHSIGLPQVSPL